jgi:hypothetical protein
VLYRIPEVHIVLFDRILIYRVQSPQARGSTPHVTTINTNSMFPLNGNVTQIRAFQTLTSKQRDGPEKKQPHSLVPRECCLMPPRRYSSHFEVFLQKFFAQLMQKP